MRSVRDRDKQSTKIFGHPVFLLVIPINWLYPIDKLISWVHTAYSVSMLLSFDSVSLLFLFLSLFLLFLYIILKEKTAAPSFIFISVATLAATDIAATLRGWVHPIFPIWENNDNGMKEVEIETSKRGQLYDRVSRWDECRWDERRWDNIVWDQGK